MNRELSLYYIRSKEKAKKAPHSFLGGYELILKNDTTDTTK